MSAFAANFSAGLAPFNPAFARDVANGLADRRRKTLPASWFYDDIGSALFEVITLLPEYGVTRADARLLSNAANEIVRAAGRPSTILELGSGSGAKTRPILNAAARTSSVRYFPIDISPAALENCAKALASIENARVEIIEASYLDGVDQALNQQTKGTPALVLFLGSTIGNFSPAEAVTFLRRLRRKMRRGDSLLVGADLVKPAAKLLSAYDDPIGVTAAFNLNLLARINRELEGEFDLAQFAHEARYNEPRARIEMHLRSRTTQKVPIGALDLAVSFKSGETIWTESSYKFHPEQIVRMGENAGWKCLRQWTECDWGFAETLFVSS